MQKKKADPVFWSSVVVACNSFETGPGSVHVRLFLTEAREISVGPVWSFVFLSASTQDKTEGPQRNLRLPRCPAETHVYPCMCQIKGGKLLPRYLETIRLLPV